MAEASALSPALAEAFHKQAHAGLVMGSPFMGRLCGLFAERGLPDTATRDIMNGWTGDLSSHGEALPVRLCGALHELVLTRADADLVAVYPPNHETVPDQRLFDVIGDAIRRNDDFLVTRLASPPQTNEIRRSSAVYAALLHIAADTGLPLRLSEIGASAGLNLLLDRFSHVYGDAERGLSTSPVRLTPEWSGPLPPDIALTVTERRGCDLAPFDLVSESDRIRLLSYNWADQLDRIERMRAAIDIARDAPPHVDRADAIDWLEYRLQQNNPGEAHVLFHTVAWQYLPEQSRQAARRLIEAAGDRATSEAPFYRLSLEMDGEIPGAALHQESWPGSTRRQLARVDSHGRWIAWN